MSVHQDDPLKERRLTIGDDINQRGIDHTQGDGLGPLDDQDPLAESGDVVEVDESALAAAIDAAQAQVASLLDETAALLSAISEAATDLNCLHIEGDCAEGTGILSLSVSTDPPSGETEEECDGIHTMRTEHPCRCCMSPPSLTFACEHLRAEKKLCGWPGFGEPQLRFTTLSMTAFELGVASAEWDVLKHSEGNAVREVSESEGVCTPGASLSLEFSGWQAICDPGDTDYDTHAVNETLFFESAKLLCGWNFEGPTVFPRYALANITGATKYTASVDHDFTRHEIKVSTAGAALTVENGSDSFSCTNGVQFLQIETQAIAIACGQGAVTYTCTGKRGTRTICGVPSLDGSEPGVLYGAISLAGTAWSTHVSADKAYRHQAGGGSVSFDLNMGTCEKSGDLSIEKQLVTMSCLNNCQGNPTGPWTRNTSIECADSVSSFNWSWPSEGNIESMASASEDDDGECEIEFTLEIDGITVATITRDGSTTFLRGDGVEFRVFGVDLGGGSYSFRIENLGTETCCETLKEYESEGVDNFCLDDLPSDFSGITASGPTSGTLLLSNKQGSANYACSGDCSGLVVPYGSSSDIELELSNRREWADGAGTVTDLGVLADCTFGITQIVQGGGNCCGAGACQIDVSAQTIELDIEATALIPGETYEITITYQGCEITPNGSGDVSGGDVSGGLCSESGDAPVISTETITFEAESATELISHSPSLQAEGYTFKVTGVDIAPVSVPDGCFEEEQDTSTLSFKPTGSVAGYSAEIESAISRKLTLGAALLEDTTFDCGECDDWELEQAGSSDFDITLASPADYGQGVDLDFVPSHVRDFMSLYSLVSEFQGDVELRYHPNYPTGLVTRARRRRVFFYLSGAASSYYVVVRYTRNQDGSSSEHQLSGIVNGGVAYPSVNLSSGHYLELPEPALGETIAYVSHQATPYPTSGASCDLVQNGEETFASFLFEPSGYNLVTDSAVLASVTIEEGLLDGQELACSSGDCQDNTGHDYCDYVACGSIIYNSPNDGFQLVLSGAQDFHIDGSSIQTFSSGVDENCIAGVTNIAEGDQFTQGGEMVLLSATIIGQSIELTIDASNLYVGVTYQITILYAVCEIATNLTGDVSGGLLDGEGDCSESGLPPVDEEDTITFVAEDTTEEITHLVEMPPLGKTRKVIGVIIEIDS
ncbi:hypothetical protein [Cerasicoccus frondis]|uniref:hypothetical protein n=1 Tax=Cerasicoccus frondis TaxID=490090 RepID=UPI002852BC14|nr:hypothetical protein [Cerasicoccus frondis]